MTKPRIGRETNMLDFLNSFEIDFLMNSENDCMTEHIKKRGMAMSDIHNLWTEYNPKTGEITIIDDLIWDLKMRELLNDKYQMEEEDINRFRGQYFDKIKRGKGE